MLASAEFAAHVRAKKETIGYWVLLDSPVGTERLARLGWDYIALDMQHGLMGYSGMVNTMIAAAAHDVATLVRVAENGATAIGRALDAGACGVIVPLVDSAEEASEAVRYAKYPPRGIRSYGPMRSALRIGPSPEVSDAQTLVFAMIETPAGLEQVEQIVQTPGLDGVYIGPSDLRLAIGGADPADASVQAEFDTALRRIRSAAESAGIICAIHNPSGEAAAQRLSQGFTMTTVAADLVHLEQAVAAHLVAARRANS